MTDGRNLLQPISMMRIFAIAAAALIAVSATFLTLAIYSPPSADAPQASDDVSPQEMRRAMSLLHEEHRQIENFVESQRQRDERKAQDEEKAREEAKRAAEREAVKKLAAERAAQEKHRVAETNAARPMQAQKPKPGIETAANAGAPLDIMAAGGVAAEPKPRGPADAVAATVGEIKEKTVSAIAGIKDWFIAAGDKLLGRPQPVPAQPHSRFSSVVE